jgi:7,8-dihydroneopterin aldolase/epimerase/oxygenase
MEAGGNGPDSTVGVELHGLSIYTHHGVTDAEQEVGQRLEIDVSMAVGDCPATETDRLEDTIDYAAAADLVARAATERSFRTLERVCRVIGERLMDRYECEVVWVRAAKPEPPLTLTVDEVAVELTLHRGGEDDSEP